MKDTFTTVPVLMVFFNRSKPLEQVFEAVRKAKPKILFLAQDGAREGNKSDEENVIKCREVVKNVDWDCEVYTDFSNVNLGCGRRMSSAITWAFEKVDRLMILEDDCVPGQSFFPFAEELLERYKDDERVSMISAMNHLEKYHGNDDSDYLFCASGAIWGWATWKRQWEHYDFNMKFIETENAFEKIKKSKYPSYYKRDLLKQGKNRKKVLDQGKKLSSWTFQYNMIRFLKNQVTIVPKVNMISNVGLDMEATHASGNLKMIPKGLHRVFFMKTYPLEFPLCHPTEMIIDRKFDKKVWTLMGMPMHIAIHRKLSSIIRRTFYGGTKEIKKMFKKIFKRK